MRVWVEKRILFGVMWLFFGKSGKMFKEWYASRRKWNSLQEGGEEGKEQGTVDLAFIQFKMTVVRHLLSPEANREAAGHGQANNPHL